jgi:hypothetical protein
VRPLNPHPDHFTLTLGAGELARLERLRIEGSLASD